MVSCFNQAANGYNRGCGQIKNRRKSVLQNFGSTLMHTYMQSFCLGCEHAHGSWCTGNCVRLDGGRRQCTKQNSSIVLRTSQHCMFPRSLRIGVNTTCRILRCLQKFMTNSTEILRCPRVWRSLLSERSPPHLQLADSTHEHLPSSRCEHTRGSLS